MTNKILWNSLNAPPAWTPLMSEKQSYQAYLEGARRASQKIAPNPIIGSGMQELPVKNNNKPIWHLVITDMLARDNVGRERYGTPLQAFNGRDALVDAYEEALDLCAYLRQAIEERTISNSCKMQKALNEL